MRRGGSGSERYGHKKVCLFSLFDVDGLAEVTGAVLKARILKIEKGQE